MSGQRGPMRMKSELILLISCLLASVSFIPVSVFAQTSQALSPEEKNGGLKQSNGPLTGDLHLQSTSGPFSFQSLRGKVVVMFFGYTHCPDVCPRDLSIIARVFSNFDAKQQAQLKGVFVSLDPARDDAKTLKDFTRYFNPDFIGITGSQKDIASLAKRYGVHYKKVPVKGSSSEYSIEHTASIFILDTQGQISLILPNGISDMALQQAIEYLLDEQHS
jgi:protein SCO1/2